MFSELKPRRYKGSSQEIQSATAFRKSYDTQNYFLPPNKTGLVYTLVLDLDETLVHYDYH